MSCWLVPVSVKVMTTGWPVAHPIICPAGFLPTGGRGGLAGAAGSLAGVVSAVVRAGPACAGAAGITLAKPPSPTENGTGRMGSRRVCRWQKNRRACCRVGCVRDNNPAGRQRQDVGACSRSSHANPPANPRGRCQHVEAGRLGSRRDPPQSKRGSLATIAGP